MKFSDFTSNGVVGQVLRAGLNDHHVRLVWDISLQDYDIEDVLVSADIAKGTARATFSVGGEKILFSSFPMPD